MTSKEEAVEKYASPVIEKYAELLSDNQKQFLENLCVLEDLTGTKHNICKQCGTTKQSFYNWVKKDYFREAFDSIIKARTGIELSFAMSSVDKSLINKAKKGSSHHARVFYQRAGLVEFTPKGTNVQVVQQVAAKLTPEERAELVKVREEQLIRQLEEKTED